MEGVGSEARMGLSGSRGSTTVLCGSLDGRGSCGEWIDVYVWLSPFTIHLKLSQYCLIISYNPIQNKKL